MSSGDEMDPAGPAAEQNAMPSAADRFLESSSAEETIHRMSRRSVVWAGVAIAAGFAGWKWLTTREEDNGIPWPLRRALQTNETLAESYFNANRTSPTFDDHLATVPRVNGDEGIEAD